MSLVCVSSPNQWCFRDFDMLMNRTFVLVVVVLLLMVMVLVSEVSVSDPLWSNSVVIDRHDE